ncbi:MAG: TetR/AcrR family transcriptional regulator [Acidimicrobiales bacterium]
MPEPEAASWRELAVARSLDSARTRAENRVRRFMVAATDLINSGDRKDFTVQDVVERSGQSLRSFYQHFNGKHELLLALFEESVASTAVTLRQRVDEETGPLERLHRFVIEYYEACSRPTGKGAQPRKGAPAVVTEFAQQLLTERPKEAARAFAPLVAIFRELLDDALDAGVVRAGLTGQASGMVLEVIMFNAFSSTIAGASAGDERNAAEDLWDLILHGIAARD